MGQGASAAQADHNRVDRAGLSEEQYQALRKAIGVPDDGPRARVDLPAFLARFRPHLRPLMQPIFFQLGRERVGEPSASWPVLVASLADFAQRGATWQSLLGAWASDEHVTGGGGDGEHDRDHEVEVCVDLAVSLCFWCAHPEMAPAHEDGGSPNGCAALDSLLAALKASVLERGEGAAAAGVQEVPRRLQAAAPHLPRAVAPYVAAALQLAPPPAPPPLPESRILDAGLVLMLRSLEAWLWESGPWAPLYRDWCDGRSFNGLLKGALHYEGPALLLVRTDAGEVLGALSRYWSEGHGKFGGGSDCLLFTLLPALRVFRSASKSGNYTYLNSRNKHAPRGLGFGGQVDFWRLWLDADFEECYALETDATFQSGPLLPPAGLQTKFQVAHIEIWGCGGAEAAVGQAEQRRRDEGQRESARKVDKAKLLGSDFDKEMFLGNTFKASAEAHSPIHAPKEEGQEEK